MWSCRLSQFLKPQTRKNAGLRYSAHCLPAKSAVQFTTRVRGVFGLTLWVVMTNRFPSGVTSYCTLGTTARPKERLLLLGLKDGTRAVNFRGHDLL